MSQASFFQEPVTLRSPLCVYEPPCGHRCELGPREDLGPECENYALRCLTCGRTGTLSVNLKAKRGEQC